MTTSKNYVVWGEPDGSPPALEKLNDKPATLENRHVSDRALNLAQRAIKQAAEPPLYLPDYPEFDGTDGAHPAWWRGNDAAVIVLCQEIHRLLDNPEREMRGVCNQPWQGVRERLAELVKSKAGINTGHMEMAAVTTFIAAHAHAAKHPEPEAFKRVAEIYLGPYLDQCVRDVQNVTPESFLSTFHRSLSPYCPNIERDWGSIERALASVICRLIRSERHLHRVMNVSHQFVSKGKEGENAAG